MLAVMPKHKGTDHLRADLRTRMSKLRDQAETQSRSGSRWNPYTVRKEGAGQVALVGLANAGKSHLMAALTGAKPRVADYPYTRWNPSRRCTATRTSISSWWTCRQLTCTTAAAGYGRWCGRRTCCSSSSILRPTR